jgi:hypothetical protein
MHLIVTLILLFKFFLAFFIFLEDLAFDFFFNPRLVLIVTILLGLLIDGLNINVGGFWIVVFRLLIFVLTEERQDIIRQSNNVPEDINRVLSVSENLVGQEVVEGSLKDNKVWILFLSHFE